MHSKTNFETEPAQRLGSFTSKYSSAAYIDQSTGEHIALELGAGGTLCPRKSPSDARRISLSLKNAVAEILPKSRTAKVCMHCQAPDFKARENGDKSACHEIQIRKNKETGVAHFSGLMMCGSVWNCPVCNRQISSHRRDELTQALSASKDLGWNVYLVTLTVPHGMGDDLKSINKMQSLAINKLSQGRNAISQQLKTYGYSLHGFVRAKEVTFGSNGFHPHFHLLVFTDAPIDTVNSIYGDAWISACVNVGLERPSDKHGVDVRSGTDAAEYVTKWGLEWEMTTGHSKNSKKGLSPYQLLHVYIEGGYSSENLNLTKEQAAGLFIRFSEAMKGERQLFWSKGLRSKLGLGVELTEEEILAQRDEETEIVVAVAPDSFRAIRYFKAFNGVLCLAENNPSLLNDYIFGIVQRYNVLQDKKTPFKDRRYKGK